MVHLFLCRDGQEHRWAATGVTRALWIGGAKLLMRGLPEEHEHRCSRCTITKWAVRNPDGDK